MKVSRLIECLKEVQAREGDIEVTCTASSLQEGLPVAVPDVWETTVETLVVREKDERFAKRVRLYL